MVTVDTEMQINNNITVELGRSYHHTSFIYGTGLPRDLQRKGWPEVDFQVEVVWGIRNKFAPVFKPYPL
ncbi:hypothetical protein TNCV_40281 [Trichonephila clavipes]|nr:hypothetical protein TNCV_40281 [Trichonephila clavipes]